MAHLAQACLSILSLTVKGLTNSLNFWVKQNVRLICAKSQFQVKASAGWWTVMLQVRDDASSGEFSSLLIPGQNRSDQLKPELQFDK